jgi:hypothetical protein
VLCQITEFSYGRGLTGQTAYKIKQCILCIWYGHLSTFICTYLHRLFNCSSSAMTVSQFYFQETKYLHFWSPNFLEKLL